MEVGRRRGLVEEEVAHGYLSFLLVLHDGPVDEWDEAFHGQKSAEADGLTASRESWETGR